MTGVAPKVQNISAKRVNNALMVPGAASCPLDARVAGTFGPDRPRDFARELYAAHAGCLLHMWAVCSVCRRGCPGSE